MARASKPGPTAARGCYDTALFPFERSLAPGETFTSAACSIGVFRDGDGLADPGYGDPRALSAGQVAWYAKRIAWFTALRKEIPIEEGFFPRGTWW